VRIECSIYIRLYIICCLNRLKELVILYTMKGVIYQIKTADGLYVGSTFDFKTRCKKHKSDLKIKPDTSLYKNIISNNGIYKIEIYCNVNCSDRRQLNFFEEQYRIILDANLNMVKAFVLVSDYNREYFNLNKEQINLTSKKRYLDSHIDCLCGGSYASKTKNRHFKTKKHLKYIKDSQTHPPL